jgi:integrase/recombinase XerD
MPKFKYEETIKETYSDDELLLLLKKPTKQADFCEFRNWVIISFLVNSGCRAATIRNIQIKDVHLKNSHILTRHNKNRKIQTIPLCDAMVSILRNYMAVRQGKDSDYLFCTEYGEMLSENALRLAIERYNERRGVLKTSTHLFRHTFARKYLIDCGGNAFTLQKLLGHSTLDMRLTKSVSRNRMIVALP